ncbi:MAG: ribonuclease III [Dehalococcoidales bacterium]|nr:ribonuclease III [Dehalococcoidales bacterium]
MAKKNLDALEERLGVTFQSRDLLEQAQVHRSYLNENPEFTLPSNERLEFLGDAILGFLTAEYLYQSQPSLPEGEMTTLRAAAVRGETLARWAQSLSLGRYLLMGRGEVSSGGRSRPGNLANTFEALLAAVAIDQGLETAREVLMRFLKPEVDLLLESETAKDYKSRLQETLQSQRQLTPTYRTVETKGPDHARTFIVEVLAGAEVLAQGSGPSKQHAEQDAARQALAAVGSGGR